MDICKSSTAQSASRRHQCGTNCALAKEHSSRAGDQAVCVGTVALHQQMNWCNRSMRAPRLAVNHMAIKGTSTAPACRYRHPRHTLYSGVRFVGAARLKLLAIIGQNQQASLPLQGPIEYRVAAQHDHLFTMSSLSHQIILDAFLRYCSTLR